MKKYISKITICLLLLCLIIVPVTANAITYYVRFNPNGGSGEMSNQTFATDEEKYLSTNTFTRTGYNFIGWNSNTSGTGTWYMPSKKVKNLTSTSGQVVDVYAQWMDKNESTIKIGSTEITKDSSENYNIGNYKNYTVQVNVTNGTVGTASKTVEYYTSPTFALTPNEGTNSPTVSCSNSQTGSITNNVLTIANVSNNTICVVTYPLKEYTITYGKGSDASSSGYPSTQTKKYGQSINLSTTEPSSDSNAFLGWNTTTSANATSGVWYDGGTLYDANSDLSLEAQWYDIGALEEWYTKAVQTGDFMEKTSSYSGGSLSQGAYTGQSFTPPTVSGYTRKMTSGWAVSDGIRAYSVTGTRIGFLGMQSFSSYGLVNRWLYIKTRTSQTYSDDEVDARIDRLLKIQDLALTYDDVKITADAYSNVTLAAKTNTTYYKAPPTGYTRYATLGFHASCTGSGQTRCSRISVSSNYLGNLRLQNNSTSSSAIISVDARWLDVKNKTARTTDYEPNQYDTIGASRYSTLNSLDTNMNKYFPESYFKAMNITQSGLGGSAWGVIRLHRYVTIPNGKIIGVSSYYTNAAYAVVHGMECWITDLPNGRTGSSTYQDCGFLMAMGNASWASDSGNANSSVTVEYPFIYISSGTATISAS